MRAAASYFFSVLILAAPSVVPTASQGPGIGGAGDSAWIKFCLDDACHIGRGRRSDRGLIGEMTLVKRKAEPGETAPSNIVSSSTAPVEQESSCI